MKNGPTQGQISRLRWLAIFLCVALFAADYGFDVMAKAVPNSVYIGLVAVAIGIDLDALRNVLLRFLQTWAGGQEDKDK